MADQESESQEVRIIVRMDTPEIEIMEDLNEDTSTINHHQTKSCNSNIAESSPDFDDHQSNGNMDHHQLTPPDDEASPPPSGLMSGEHRNNRHEIQSLPVKMNTDTSSPLIPKTTTTLINATTANCSINTNNQLITEDEKDTGVLSEGETDNGRRKSSRRARRLFHDLKDGKIIIDAADSDYHVTTHNHVNHNPDKELMANESMVTDESDPLMQDSKEARRKQRRGWNVWTATDTRSFFTALAEHGKDFQAIQAYIQMKGLNESGKKNKNMTHGSTGSISAAGKLSPTIQSSKDAMTLKTREQVRHYYYRMWHKISSALNDITRIRSDHPDSNDVYHAEVDKAILELYGLINYGEIWKKIGSKFDRKIKGHLRELVMEGSTVIKGINKPRQKQATGGDHHNSSKNMNKNLKIKTPNCKALRKINGLIPNDTHDDHHFRSTGDDESTLLRNQKSLPSDVTIELLPGDHESYLRIQELAQNPKLKSKVNISSRVSSFVSFLQNKKWNRDKIRMIQREFFVGSSHDDPDFVPLKSSVKKDCILLKLHEKILSSLENPSTDVKIVKSGGSYESLVPVDNPVATTSASISPCNLSSADMASHAPSFKFFLQNLKHNKIPVAASSHNPHPKGKKDKTHVGPKSFEEKKDTPAPQASGSDVPTVIHMDVEDSCSSTSSFAPFKETFKKLNQLNQVLGESNKMDDSQNGNDESEVRVANGESVDHVESDNTPLHQMTYPIVEEVSLPPEDLNIAQWLKLKEQRQMILSGSHVTPEKKRPDAGDEVIDDDCESRDGHNHDLISLDLDTLKSGWTEKTSSLTFGELYLILGCPSNIVFTYEFIREEETSFSEGLCLTDQFLSQRRKRSSLLNRVIESSIFALTVNRKSGVSCPNTIAVPQLKPLINHQSVQQHPTASAIINNTTTTIYNSPPKTVVDSHTSGMMTYASHNHQNGSNSPGQQQTSHNFLMPTAPAPRAVVTSTTASHAAPFSSSPQPDQQQSCTNLQQQPQQPTQDLFEKKNVKRQRNVICEDPQLVQDALKQLNANKIQMSRKRPRVIRPTTVGPVCSRDLFPSHAGTSQVFLHPTGVNQHIITNQNKQQLVTLTHGTHPHASNQIFTAHQVQMLQNAVNHHPLQLIASGPGGQQSFHPIQPQTSTALPICLTSSQFSMPTLLIAPTNIPTVITANQLAGGLPTNIATVNGNNDQSASPSILNPVNVINANHDEQRHQDPTDVEVIDLGTPTKLAQESSSLTTGVTSSSSPVPPQFSLSSLLDLSLPEAPVVTSSSSSVSSNLNPFFGENSCSSISDLISSFGQQNSGSCITSNSQQGLNLMAQNMMTSVLNNNNSNSGMNGIRTGQSDLPSSTLNRTPNWLINEGSNSSLGLSSLMSFNSNDGLV